MKNGRQMDRIESAPIQRAFSLPPVRYSPSSTLVLGEHVTSRPADMTSPTTSKRPVEARAFRSDRALVRSADELPVAEEVAPQLSEARPPVEEEVVEEMTYRHRHGPPSPVERRTKADSSPRARVIIISPEAADRDNVSDVQPLRRFTTKDKLT